MGFYCCMNIFKIKLLSNETGMEYKSYDNYLLYCFQNFEYPLWLGPKRILHP